MAGQTKSIPSIFKFAFVVAACIAFMVGVTSFIKVSGMNLEPSYTIAQKASFDKTPSTAAFNEAKSPNYIKNGEKYTVVFDGYSLDTSSDEHEPYHSDGYVPIHVYGYVRSDDGNSVSDDMVYITLYNDKNEVIGNAHSRYDYESDDDGFVERYSSEKLFDAVGEMKSSEALYAYAVENIY